MKLYPTMHSFALAALLAISLPPTPSEAVSISLVPDGSTTIEIGESVNVDVFMVLDAADQVAGIEAVTMQLELGSGFVDVVASSSGSVFPGAIVNAFQPLDFIAFSQFGVIVRSPKALLGSLSITGRAQGSYDLVARRFEGFPQFTAPGDRAAMNRYDFASNEALVITVVCGTGPCPVGSPSPIEPWPPEPPPITPPMEEPPPPVVPDLPPEEPPEIAEPPADDPPPEIADPPATPPGFIPATLITTIINTTTFTETGTFAGTLFSPTGGSQLIPEPSTFALLGLAVTGLMLLRSPRRERSRRSPGS